MRRNVFVIFLYHIQSLGSLKQTWKACYKRKKWEEMGGKLLAFTFSLISTLAASGCIRWICKAIFYEKLLATIG